MSELVWILCYALTLCLRVIISLLFAYFCCRSDLKHPSICDDETLVDRLINISHEPYNAMSGSHAIVVCTEWDEFKVSANPSLFCQ